MTKKLKFLVEFFDFINLFDTIASVQAAINMVGLKWLRVALKHV